jgi:hypothetical protein
VNVTYAWDVGENASDHSAAFCRFGMLHSNAEAVSDSAVVCRAPPRPAQAVRVAISFDGVHWSTDRVRFVYSDRRNFWARLGAVAIYAMVGAGVAAFTWVACAKAGGGRGRAESRPFIAAAAAAGKKARARRRIDA